MTRSAEIAFSASENRSTSEAVEYGVEAWGDTPIGQLFASIRSQREPRLSRSEPWRREASAALRTKLRRRKAGRVRLSDPEIGELVRLRHNAIHHDYPAGTLRAPRFRARACSHVMSGTERTAAAIVQSLRWCLHFLDSAGFGLWHMQGRHLAPATR
jgi:hypothetical protein